MAADAGCAPAWWGSTLYLTGRGLTTSLIPAEPGRAFAIDVDLIASRVEVRATDGASRTVPLEPQSVACSTGR